MGERRKVLFVNGMSNDFLLIITDAPKKDIEDYCVYHNTMTEDGEHFELFETLKASHYVKELLDSEIDEREDVEIIGFDEVYDFGGYRHLMKRKSGIRTIKLFGGLTGEFELIITNAPDSVLEAHMTYVSACQKNGEPIEKPYALIESMGFFVGILGSHEDFTEEELAVTVIDKEFDYYQF